MLSFSWTGLLEQNMCWNLGLFLYYSFPSQLPNFTYTKKPYQARVGLILDFYHLRLGTHKRKSVFVFKLWILRFFPLSAVWHEEADVSIFIYIIWIIREHFSQERRWMMSPTLIGFVFLLGILHVCSGKSLVMIQSNLLAFNWGFTSWNEKFGEELNSSFNL